jgi:hypothetical protein
LFNRQPVASAAPDDAEIRAADGKHERQWAYSVGVQSCVFEPLL